MSGRREKAGLLATALANHSSYFHYDPAQRLAQVDDVEVDMEGVSEAYDLAVQELRVACSTEVAYPDM